MWFNHEFCSRSGLSKRAQTVNIPAANESVVFKVSPSGSCTAVLRFEPFGLACSRSWC
jgi:hypothetical protein